ncbi:MAG: LysR family transcriptional regulator [Rhodospirillales bacterium]
MELRQLEAFYWIVRLGSFNAAAKALNTTQPAISMRIRELQRDLGVALFDTATRRAHLTAKGRDLFDYAESMLNLASTIHSRMGDPAMLSGHIRVGATETIALTWLPDLVGRMNEAYPQIVLELEIGLTLDLWAKLSSGEFDVVMLPGPILEVGLEWHHLGRIDYSWMASPSLGYQDRVLSPQDLEQVPILSLPKASSLHVDTERWFRSSTVNPNRVYFCNSLNVVSALTKSGLGVSLLPPEIFAEAVTSGELCILDVQPAMPPLDFFVACAQKPVSPLPIVVAETAMAVTRFRDAGSLSR